MFLDLLLVRRVRSSGFISEGLHAEWFVLLGGQCLFYFYLVKPAMDAIGASLNYGQLPRIVIERVLDFAQFLRLLLHLGHFIAKFLFLGTQLNVLVPQVFNCGGDFIFQGILHLLHAPCIFNHLGVFFQVSRAGFLVVSAGPFKIIKRLPERGDVSIRLNRINLKKIFDYRNVIVHVLGGYGLRLGPDPGFDR